jgi:hypothetical protein
MGLMPICSFVLLLFTISILFLVPGTQAQNSNLTETATGHIDLSKTSSSNMIISKGTSFVGSFDTTYTITGTASDIKDSKDVIVSSIIDDFTNTSTIGYVKVPNSESSTSNTQEIANPFASNEQIEQKVQELLEESLVEATNAKTNLVSISCNFGSSLDLFSCSKNSLLD